MNPVFPPTEDLLFGRQVQLLGLATREQLESARAFLLEARGKGSEVSLGEALVRSGALTAAQRQEVLTSLKPVLAGGSVREGESRAVEQRQLGPYRLVRKLGEGGMGSVYLAEDTLLLRKVAIKILSPKYAANEMYLARFEREARAAGSLNHEHIAAAFAVGQEGGLRYYAMEFCEGQSLGDRLRGQGVLLWRQALDYLSQAADGLGYAHRQGFIHRDIKPDNIFLTRQHAIKILDLGLAKDIDCGEAAGLTQRGTTVGTPLYISPEQARGARDLDGRADIYSLGATFYHLLAGRPPFEGESPAVVMAHHLTADFPCLADLNPEVPENLSQVIDRMLAREREDRYRDCEALLADLERVKAGEPPREASSHEENEEDLPKLTRPPRRKVQPGRPPVRGWGPSSATSRRGRSSVVQEAITSSGATLLRGSETTRLALAIPGRVAVKRLQSLFLLLVALPLAGYVLWLGAQGGRAGSAPERPGATSLPPQPRVVEPLKATQPAEASASGAAVPGASPSPPPPAPRAEVLVPASAPAVPASPAAARPGDLAAQPRAAPRLPSGVAVTQSKAVAPAPDSRPAEPAAAIPPASHPPAPPALSPPPAGSSAAAVSEVAALFQPQHWAGAKDLLPLLDPKDSLCHGKLNFLRNKSGARTLSAVTGWATLEVPWTAPEECDVLLEFSVPVKTSVFSLWLKHSGRRFAFMVAGQNNDVSLKLTTKNPDRDQWITKRTPRPLPVQTPMTAVVRVRKDAVESFFEGSPAVQWRADGGQAPLDGLYTFKLNQPDHLGLGFGAQGLTLHRFLLLPSTVEDPRQKEAFVSKGPPPPPPQRAGGLREGLVAYWPFDREPVKNEVSGQPARNHGAQSCPGVSGKAFSFDGREDWVEGEDSPVGPAFSLGLWFAPSRVEGAFTILGKHNVRGENLLVLESVSGELILKSGIRSAGGHFSSRVAFQPRVWRQLTLVGAPAGPGQTQVVLYLDGQEAARGVARWVLGDLRGKGWALGQDWDGDKTSGFYEGLLDEVALWNRALTATEVAQLYRAGKAGRGILAAEPAPSGPASAGAVRESVSTQAKAAGSPPGPAVP